MPRRAPRRAQGDFLRIVFYYVPTIISLCCFRFFQHACHCDLLTLSGSSHVTVEHLASSKKTRHIALASLLGRPEVLGMIASSIVQSSSTGGDAAVFIAAWFSVQLLGRVRRRAACVSVTLLGLFAAVAVVTELLGLGDLAAVAMSMIAHGETRLEHLLCPQCR